LAIRIVSNQILAEVELPGLPRKPYYVTGKMGSAAINVKSLSKQFGKLVAVSDASFQVKRGEIFGLLGPNGSGKSTILRILAGILKPSSGKVRVLDFSLPRKAKDVQKRLGYLPQRAPLYPSLSVSQSFRFYCNLYGLSDRKRIQRAQDKLFANYGLSPYENTLVRYLSGGFRQRLALVCSLAHRPKILLLDEPTVGIDPITRRELWDHFYELSRGQHMTIVVTTHYLEEAERCDKVALLGQGQILLEGAPNEIVRDERLRPVFSVSTDEPFRLLEYLRGRDGLADVYEYGEAIKIVCDDRRKARQDIEKLAKSCGVSIQSIAQITPNVEDVFIQLTKLHRQQGEPNAE
jgi:ABC-2 type transport system ATP-binding protein